MNQITSKYLNKIEELMTLETTIEERKKIIESLNNEYFNEVGEVLPAFILEILGTWLLKEVYGDKRTNKVTAEEFPVLSENQLVRRKRKIVYIGEEHIIETLNYHLRNNSSTSKKNEQIGTNEKGALNE